jgi:hypothetical protein
MKRPARVRVLGKQFAISFVPVGDAGLRDGPDDKSPGSGRCDADKQAIFVEDGQPLESEQDTTLHEVLHAIEHSMGMDVEELVIQRLATGLLAVIKDNPSFVRYLAAKK